MSSLRICRICLRTEAKGYKFDQYQLKYFYEEVTAQKIAENDELPKWFCYECATILHKFHKFKEKCYIGQKCMKEMLRKGPISYEAIYKLDRATKHLKSTLDRFILTDRDRIFTVKDKEMGNKGKLKDIDKANTKKIKIKTENSNLNRDGDTMKDLGEFLHFINSVENDKKTTHEEKQNDFHENHEISVQKNQENHNICNENHGSDNEDKSKQNHDIEGNDNSLCSEYETKCDTNTSDNPTSPISILVEKDRILIPKPDNINESKTHNLEISITLSESGKILNEKNWKRIILTEDEAINEFRKKAEDTKYLEAAFKCTDCFKEFSKKDMLMRHLQNRHNEELGVHECRFCRMRFKWQCHLRRHIQQHYTKYVCLLCGAGFNLDSSALLHEEWHSGAPRSCGHCGQQFRHVTTYYTHVRTHRSAHVCVTCGASFVSENGLLLHTKRRHNGDDMDSPSSDADDVGSMYCTCCDIWFRSQRAFTEHLFHSDMHSEVIKEEPDDKIPSKKIMSKRLREKITKEMDNRKPELETSSPVKVKRRRKKTNKAFRKKPSTCYQCGEQFSSQSAYSRHHAAAHRGTSLFAPAQRHICELCGVSLAPGSVSLHQNLHSRAAVFRCEVCARDFYCKNSLRRHMRSHTGEKPFACPLCEKRFTQSNSMKLHYRTFHLKQPYPKRQRTKKQQPQSTEQDTFESDSVSQEPTREAPPEARPQDTHNNIGYGDENIHYLTLS